MTATETLKARVDKGFAREVQRWAKAHDADVSEAIRIALRKLLEEDSKERRIAAAMKQLRELEAKGVFDPPPGGRVPMGGFK